MIGIGAAGLAAAASVGYSTGVTSVETLTSMTISISWPESGSVICVRISMVTSRDKNNRWFVQ